MGARLSIRIFTAFIILVLLLSTNATVNAKASSENHNKHELVFGVLPIVSTQRLVLRFGPLADYLSEKLGKPVRIETAPNYAEFVRRTNIEKRYDLLFTAPHLYYLAQRSAGYRVIVRVDMPVMRALIVVPKTSNIHALQDLRGKSLATVDPLGLGTILVRALLSDAGIDPDKDLMLVTTPTHNASLLSAYKHITDAACLMLQPYQRTKPEIKSTMRVIAETKGTPHMPISVAPRLSKNDAQQIEDILLGLNSSDRGRALLKHLNWPGFAKTNPHEYDKIKWAAQQIKLK